MISPVQLDRGLISDPALSPIAGKIERGERLSTQDGVTLFASPDLLGIGHMADTVNRAKHGNRVTFAANQHINPTNVCILRKTCVFCSYARLPKEEGAYRYTMDQVWEEAATANSTLTDFGAVKIGPADHAFTDDRHEGGRCSDLAAQLIL